MTNEQNNRIVLMLDALRIAVLATTIPVTHTTAMAEAREASDKQAEDALKPIVDVGSILQHR